MAKKKTRAAKVKKTRKVKKTTRSKVRGCRYAARLEVRCQKQWYLLLVQRNGQTRMTAETYHHKGNAVRGAGDLQALLDPTARVIEWTAELHRVLDPMHIPVYVQDAAGEMILNERCG